MATAIQIKNPSPTRALKTTSMAFFSSQLSFGSKVSTRWLSHGLLPLHHQKLSKRSISAFVASHKDSKHSNTQAEDEKNDNTGAKESKVAWKQTIACAKEEVLKDSTLTEESKEFLSTAIDILEKAPESVMDILEAFLSYDSNEMKDSYVGIRYGVFLALGGFLSFMLTGSNTAIRYGVILGGTLLALSISSKRSLENGKSSSLALKLALKGQAAIVGVLFVKAVRMLFERFTLASFLAVLISYTVVVRYFDWLRGKL